MPDDTSDNEVLRCSQCKYLMVIRNGNTSPYRPPRKFVPAGGARITNPGSASIVKTQPIFPSLDTPVDFDEVIRRATNAICPGLNVYR